MTTNAGGTFDERATCAYGLDGSNMQRTVSDAYSGVNATVAVFHHELVEVAEVAEHVFVGDVAPAQDVVCLDASRRNFAMSWSMTNAVMSSWKSLTSSGV